MESVTWKIHLKSPPEKVFGFLTSDQGRQKFWAEKSEQHKQSITFHFPDGTTQTATILEAHTDSLFRIRYFNSTVSFFLKPDHGGGTDLTMVNEGLEPAEYHLVLAGWVSVLLSLKAAADHGVDLRNHDATRTWDRHYADN